MKEGGNEEGKKKRRRERMQKPELVLLLPESSWWGGVIANENAVARLELRCSNTFDFFPPILWQSFKKRNI